MLDLLLKSSRSGREETGVIPSPRFFATPIYLPRMTFRLKASAMKADLPGGNWAVLREPDELTGADQDAYFEQHDRLLAARPQEPPRPDPDNPAQMLPSEPPKLENSDWRTLRDYALGIVITSWSYDLPLPFTAASKKHLSLKACNALYEAVRPVQRALNGAGDEEDEEQDPKQEVPSGTGGSADTLPGTSQDRPPESPGQPPATPQA